MGFEETVQYLYDLQKFGTKLGLDNIRALLELLGSPEKGRRFLHVTGTNGKGSVCALAASALNAAGHKTGLYTSPHLVSFTERISVGGVEISEQRVVELTERLKGLLAADMPGLKPTFFEFTTAIAFDYFAREGADPVVLEVGMGGRLDATNAVTPVACVITNAELEHRQYLGETVMEIAREKAGIIKPGAPVVTSEKKPEVLGYFEDAAGQKGSRLYTLGRDFSFRPRGLGWEGGRFFQELDYFGPGGDLVGVRIPLAGEHQAENAATAICALGLMAERGVEAGPDAIRAGFAAVRWAGRLETVPGRVPLVLDGAHNPASAARLAGAIRTQFAGRYDRLILVLGVLADKDFVSILETLAPLADMVCLTQADYGGASPAASLVSTANALGVEAVIKDTVAGALKWALGEAGTRDMVLVTGSLYVVGEAKAWLGGRGQFLKA